MDLTVIVPCFNEEDNIKDMPGELIPYIKNLNKVEILVIDDGSSDNTVKEVRKLQKKYKFIRLVIHKKNKGLGAALRTGIKKARGELVVTIDSDYTLHPRYIEPFVRRFEKGDVDCVVGSPYLYKSSMKTVSWYRKTLSRGINFIYFIMIQKEITSLTPIFRVYRTSDLKNMKIESDGFEAVTEILIKLILMNKKIVELPIDLTKRVHGESKINLYKEIRNHLKLILKVIIWKHKSKRWHKKAKN